MQDSAALQTSRAGPILVFDSGVGGLSVAAEIQALLPAWPVAYAADNGFFPYGTKEEGELIDRVEAVMEKLIARIDPPLIVIACNTASTVVLPRLRARWPQIPVVGTVPAIKPAAARSRSRTIGILGTPGTVRRAYTQALLDQFAPDCNVVRVGSAELVQLAERRLRGGVVESHELEPILAPFVADPACDTIVLACTHFPLLRPELIAASARPFDWIDSGRAIAARVATLLADAGAEPTGRNGGGVAWFTEDEPSVAALASSLARFGLQRTRTDIMSPLPEGEG
ncbi:glutamate racemase [Roseiterribacter gracilis]|uniref:Glutamate racemase n=1 Tax=Roseiterribacter gracilis TaxID=2812848 RepID=A0A8S8XCQ9_9PROT|nr:glutamate racemase [Rhodospirillales bacterium TMPK1]